MTDDWQDWRLQVALDAVEEAAPESAAVIREELARLHGVIETQRGAIDRALSSQPVDLMRLEETAPRFDLSAPPPMRAIHRDRASPVTLDLRIQADVATTYAWRQRIDPRKWRLGRDPWYMLESMLRDGLREAVVALAKADAGGMEG